jgi:hypothetical protein
MATPNIQNLAGTGYQQLQIPRLSPQQQQLFSQVMGGATPGIMGGIGQLSQMAAGGTPEMWEQMEAPALAQFAGLQGQLASRFSGMGTGARRSSGFQQATGAAASDLAQQLQAQRTGLQQQAIRDLMGLYGNLMGTQQFETALIPQETPWWQNLLGSLGGIGGQLGGLGLMRGMGLF